MMIISNDEHQFHMGFRTQSVYATSIEVVIQALNSERSMDLCFCLSLPCTLDVVWF
jgi:hypothetical protein